MNYEMVIGVERLVYGHHHSNSLHLMNASSLSSITLRALNESSHAILTTNLSTVYHCHFTDEAIEARRG